MQKNRNIQKIFILKSIIFFVLVGIQFETFCAEKTNVAVLMLEVSGGLPETYAPVLTDRLRQELFKTDVFKVMERGEMSAILDEIGFQMTGCTSNECVVEAGKILGVNYMISGTVGKLGEMHTITLRLISVETSEIIKMETIDHIGPIEEILTLKMKEIVRKLAGIEQAGMSQLGEMVGLGKINLKGDPAGAKVIFDGNVTASTTPILLEDISAGMHTIRLEKGNEVGSMQIFVMPNVTSEVNIPLKTGYGSVNIVSTPSKVDVYIDSIFIGKTPVRLDTLLAGIHILEFKSGRFTAYKEVFDIKLNQMLNLQTKLGFGSLFIFSKPLQISAILNGEYVGKTPIEIDSVLAGKNELVLKSEGIKEYSEIITININEIYYFHKTLVKAIPLIINSKPEGTTVFFDGLYFGKTPCIIEEVSFGYHNIQYLSCNNLFFTKKINVDENCPKEITIDSVSIGNPVLNGMEFVLVDEGNSNEFFLQTTELTQSQWKEIMTTNPSNHKGDNLPVENVSFIEIQEFINKLNEKAGGEFYRLPTISEWRFACTGGKDYGILYENPLIDLDSKAWYKKNSQKKTHIVATKKPNEFGLYDMHGNVREWVLRTEKFEKKWKDYYFEYAMGGSYKSKANKLKSSSRKSLNKKVGYKDMGFRLVWILEI